MKPYKDDDPLDSFLSEFAYNITSTSKMPICEFAKEVLFNGSERFQLFPTQKAILKSFYNEPLSDEERSILQGWKEEDRTTWVEDRHYISLVLEAGRRASKAITLTSLIATPEGYKLYRDIHPGDYVFTPKGKPTKVIAETEVFTDRKCYKLTFQNGETVECSADHEWKTWDKSARKSYGRAKNPTKHPEIRTTQEIVDTLYVERKDGRFENNHSIGLTQPLKYPEQDLLIHPYCLGLWLGDGFYKSGMITSSKEDIDFVRSKFESLHYDTELVRSKYAYRFKSDRLNKELKKLGLLNKKDKLIPNNYLIGSIEQRLELLRGLMDSDGHVDKKGKAYFTNTNTNLSDLVYRLALSLGCSASRTYKTGKYKKNGKEFICKDYVQVSLRPLLTPVSIPRKAKRYKPCSCQNNKRFIVKAEEIKSVPVKCITVEDPEHLFLIGEELIPTHNCNAEFAKINTTVGIISYKELHNRLQNGQRIGIQTYDLNTKELYTTFDIKTELNQIEEVFKVQTTNNKKEITNSHHPYYKLDKETNSAHWCKLSNLEAGDKIAVSNSINLWGPKILPKKELERLAFILSLSKKDEVYKFKILTKKEVRPFFKNNKEILIGNHYIRFRDYKYSDLIDVEELNILSLESSVALLKRFCELSYYIQLHNNNKTVDFICKNEFRTFIQSLFNKLGIETRIIKKGLRISTIDSLFDLTNLIGWGFTGDEVLLRQHVGTKSSLDNVNKDKVYALEKLGHEEIHFEKIKHIKSLGIHQTIALEVKGTHIIANEIVSHNSTMSSIICLKEFYDLITLDSPAEHYGMFPGSPLSILVLAQSKAQVKDTIFSAIRGYAEGSLYFKNMHKRGEIQILSEEIRCPSKNVAIYAKHTRTEALVGYTIKCLILDEVARFQSVGEDGRNKAFEIWKNVACHKEDNLIYTKDGAYTAKELLNNPQPILTYDLKTGVQYYTDNYNVFNNGVKQVSRVETSTGRFCETTQEHPYLVWRPNKTNPEWIERKDLLIGDTIAISSNNISFRETDIYNCNLSRILGYLISDGNITTNNKSIRQRFINTDKNIIDDFNNCLKNWDSNFYLRLATQECDHKYIISRKDTSTKSNKLINWLREIKIASHNAQSKYIPTYLFKASKKEVTNFIAGLYMGDGSIPNFRDTSKIHIEYCSISKKLVEQLQELLLRLGILSYKTTRHTTQKNRKTSYKLIISNTDSIKLFNKEIPLISYKKEDLKSKLKVLNNRTKHSKSKFDYLPIGFKKLLKENKDLKLSSSFYGEKLNKVRTTFNYAETLDIKESCQWLTKNILWDTITSIEDLGKHNTIGLTIPDTNIIGGSIITHNTGGAGFKEHFKKVAISSAWEPGDPIEVLYEEGKNSTLTLGFKLTTFQVNLDLVKGVTPSVVQDYETDFVKARREFEGIRFNKFNSFIDKKRLEKACTGSSCLDATPTPIDIGEGESVRKYAGIQINRLANQSNPEELSFIHIDPALKKDSAGLAIATPVKIDGENKWKIRLDGVIKWEPHTDERGFKRIVSFLNIESVLNELIEKRNIFRVTFDQWNSESLIQKLHSNGIDSQTVSCTRDAQFQYYMLFRDLLNHDYIILPKDSLWTGDIITELSELILKPNKQIIHPYAAKDMADAVVNSVFQAHQYMIRSGMQMNYGLGAAVAQGSILPKITLTNTDNLKIGSARDKLYKNILK